MSVVPKGNMLLIMDAQSGFSRRAIKDAETEGRPPIDGDYGEFMEETERGRECVFLTAPSLTGPMQRNAPIQYQRLRKTKCAGEATATANDASISPGREIFSASVIPGQFPCKCREHLPCEKFLAFKFQRPKYVVPYLVVN